jgi:hypothetical protein
LWRWHILPPQQALPSAFATFEQHAAPVLQQAAASLQQSALTEALFFPQQAAPSLQQAAPSLQQSALAAAALSCLQQLAPSLQQEAPSLQHAAFAWLSPGLSAGAAGAAVCAHMLTANSNVISNVLNFMMNPHFRLVSLKRRFTAITPSELGRRKWV